MGFQGASTAGKGRGMNTYTIYPLNSFGMCTYAMGDFLKSFGMNTYAKYPGGGGIFLRSTTKKHPSRLEKPTLASAEAFCENLSHAPHTT
jgi:hypothetical protein